jgi:hypothetical protein
MLDAESSGIMYTTAAAETTERTAPPYRANGGNLMAAPATGRSIGENSMAVPISGSTLSLDASKTPNRSLSSANFKRGAADFSVNPALSSFVNNPSSDVYIKQIQLHVSHKTKVSQLNVTFVKILFRERVDAA